ncbi:unnamed protein product [Auanema sp. JU1783]|nr:unnamed protein product [Auanema sp. JU1783]
MADDVANLFFNGSLDYMDTINATVDTISSLPRDEGFTLTSVFHLHNTYFHDWWEITVFIFIWMALSYNLLFLGAALTASIFLRRHTSMLLFVTPLLVLCVVGPLALSTITSMSLAFALSAASQPVSAYVCAFLGVVQTVMVIVVSFSRLLGTL